MERLLLKLYLMWKKAAAHRERRRIDHLRAENIRLQAKLRRLAAAMEEVAAMAETTVRVDAEEVREAATLALDENYTGQSFLFPANFHPPVSLFRRPPRRRPVTGLPACGAGEA